MERQKLIRYGFWVSHQVQDTIGGKPVIVTYCTVCRTGRVFEPVVNGKNEKFRLVGMDHFNAMFEDATTKSWWRYGKRSHCRKKQKGNCLKFSVTQTSLSRMVAATSLCSLIMQPDSSFIKLRTTRRFKYEKRKGKSKNSLTGTDSLSWKDKSWVIGVKVDNERKAYDWNKLKAERIIHDKIENTRS